MERGIRIQNTSSVTSLFRSTFVNFPFLCITRHHLTYKNRKAHVSFSFFSQLKSKLFLITYITLTKPKIKTNFPVHIENFKIFISNIKMIYYGFEVPPYCLYTTVN